MGGAGFLGSHLCDRLLDEGAERVVSVDNLSTGSESNHAGQSGEKRFELLKHDVCEPLKVAGDVHYVFNLASPASPFDYAKLWLETMRVGSLGTQHGLELAQAKRAVFLQASTSEIYGDPLVHPQREDYLGNVDSTGPRAVYDEAKRYGEAMVSAFRRERGVSTRIVRIFNTYGPRMRLNDGRVVPAFVGQALRGENFTVFGDGSQTRSFCYVDDEVEGLMRLALSNEMDPVNIGNPQELTLLQFAEAVRKAAGGAGQIEFKPLPKGDPKQRKPDITRAKALLGWEPKVPLEQGLKPTIEYFRTKVKDPLITLEQVREAHRVAQQSHIRIGEALIRTGAVDDSKLTDFLSRQYGVPAINLADLDVAPEVIKLVPRDIAEKYAILPVNKGERSLIVAMADPSNIYAVDDLKYVTGLNIEPVVASEVAIRDAIAKYYGPK